MKNPAVLLYTSDFITGTLFMSNEEVGAYIRLLCMQHQKGHLSKQEILQICKSEIVFNSIMIHFKQDSEGLYFNERMDQEKEKRTKYSESRANNRKKKEKTYEKDMENKNENINIYINNNKELNNIFLEFLKIRKKLKAVNSERAIKSLLKKLEPYDDETKYKMIEQSIIKSWKDIYELKNNYKTEKPLPEWFGKEIEEEVNKDAEEFAKRVRGED